LLGDGSHSQRSALLGTRHVAWLLLWLSSSSPAITALHESWAVRGKMGADAWLRFVRAEQLSSPGQQADDRHSSTEAQACRSESSASQVQQDVGQEKNDEIQRARELFKRTLGGELQPDTGLNLLQFTLQLLDPQNDAVMKTDLQRLTCRMRLYTSPSRSTGLRRRTTAVRCRDSNHGFLGFTAVESNERCSDPYATRSSEISLLASVQPMHMEDSCCSGAAMWRCALYTPSPKSSLSEQRVLNAQSASLNPMRQVDCWDRRINGAELNRL
jgi:hypothetical protein